MNVNIDVAINGDNGSKDSYRVVLNQDELTSIIKSKGVEAGNDALDLFVKKFTGQFKERLSQALNR